MKRQLLVPSALAFAALHGFAADQPITIYGRLDVTVGLSDSGSVRQTDLQSYVSRIGFKGAEQLGDGLQAIWQIEQRVNPDDANSSAFAGRDSFVGLSGGFGTLTLGNIDTPYKQLRGRVGTLWSNADALEIIINGNGAGPINANTRQINQIQYTSPVVDGLRFRAHFSPDETKTSNGPNKSNFSFSGDYAAKDFDVGLAYDQKNDWAKQGKKYTSLKATAGISVDQLTFGGAWSRHDNDDGAKYDAYMVMASIKTDALLYKLTFATQGETASSKHDGAKMVGIEADYPLSKRSTLYGFYSRIDNESAGTAFLSQGSSAIKPSKPGNNPSSFSIGIRHNF